MVLAILFLQHCDDQYLCEILNDSLSPPDMNYFDGQNAAKKKCSQVVYLKNFQACVGPQVQASFIP